jgi:1-pyrroline-5-carboxylate dehydrogenase
MFAAALCLEVGKNRMEGLGEAQEAADFFSTYAQEFERNDGFSRALPDDPLPDYRSRNRSVLKPHGVWAVIAPFNFPLALMAGPTAAEIGGPAATPSHKGATDTPWAGRLPADLHPQMRACRRACSTTSPAAAAWPGGARSHRTLPGSPSTGSHEVGMRIAAAC